MLAESELSSSSVACPLVVDLLTDVASETEYRQGLDTCGPTVESTQ